MSPPLSETIRMMMTRRVRRTTIIWSRTHPRRSPWTLPPSWTATWRELWRASSSRQIVQIFCRRSHTWRVSLLEQKCLLLCFSVLVSVRFKNSAMCGGVSVLLACCLLTFYPLHFGKISTERNIISWQHKITRYGSRLLVMMAMTFKSWFILLIMLQFICLFAHWLRLKKNKKVGKCYKDLCSPIVHAGIIHLCVFWCGWWGGLTDWTIAYIFDTGMASGLNITIFILIVALVAQNWCWMHNNGPKVST